MTNEMLATYANLSLYSAMGVFTIAMVAFAVDLAGLTPRVAARAGGASDVSPDEARAGVTYDADAVIAVRTAAAIRGDRSTASVLTVDERGPDAGGPRGAIAPAPGASGETDAGPGRPRRAAGIAMALTYLGAVLSVAACLLRGLSVHRAPLGNMFEFGIVGSTFVVLVFSVLSLRRDLRWLGIFVVGPVLLTQGLSITVFYTQASQLLPSLKSYWLLIHVTVATLSVALFTIAFSATVLYLVKAHREEHPPARPSFMESRVMPSSAALDRMAYGLHVVAFPLWTFTLIAGAIWAEQAWGHYWNWDPKEVWTFVIWVVYAAYLHARATTGWSARRAAYLALAGYAGILVSFGIVNVFFVGQHSYSGLL